jgi:hypothetical protein
MIKIGSHEGDLINDLRRILIQLESCSVGDYDVGKYITYIEIMQYLTSKLASVLLSNDSL